MSKKVFLAFILTINIFVPLNLYAIVGENNAGENIEGVVNDDNGNIKFKADKVLFENKEKIHLEDNVNIVTEEGISVKTQALDWDRSQGSVESGEKVFIEKDKAFNAEGKGLAVDTNNKQAVLKKEVSVKIPQEDLGFIFVTCEGPLDIDYQNSKAVFYNNVEINNDDMKLYSDQAVIYFNSELKTIDKIVAEGNVRIVRGKNTSYSQKATYVNLTKKITLEGEPRLILFPEKKIQ